MRENYKGEIRQVQLTIQGAKGPVIFEQWNGFAWVPIAKVTKEMIDEKS